MVKNTDIREIKKSAVELISDNWALVTAGKKDSFNTMTVSWGGLGEIWGKDAAFIFIRPQRHTLKFIDSEEMFTICFFKEEYKKALTFCGRNSGRDVDKVKETGLTPVFLDDAVYFDEACIVLKCRKMARYDLSPDGFLDSDIESNYSNGDYHKMFIAEIVETLVTD
ncbi:MAG: flavin reductase [Clostridia bacterium]|nr:flavin reductase [Clostridia bacterium]MBQ7054581.1 flavin reductase [Oscillospiraceae bacterium]